MSQELILQASRFTTMTALVNEIVALLASSDYKLFVIVSADEKERLEAEFESTVLMGRIKLVVE